MSNAVERKSKPPRRQRSIQRVHYDIKRREEMARPLAWPSTAPAHAPLEVHAYTRQVAGHTRAQHAHAQPTKYLGLLQCEGKVLKPIIKEAQRREIEFYKHICAATEPDLVELRECVPKYYGCTKYTYEGHTQDYIILEDLTKRMLEPCIMDVKIGKRTWDPLATEEKRLKEESKYSKCKEQYGFCIPGFQVYRADTGRLCRYNKDYGKKLQGDNVKEAIRTFLNGCEGSMCRVLLLQLLTDLWKVQRWSRHNTRLRIYSSSLLLAYDAADLRTCCRGNSSILCRPATVPLRRRSVPSLPSHYHSTLSGSLTPTGPTYRKLHPVSLTPMTLSGQSFSPPPPLPSTPWSKALDHLAHNHSFDHNYEDNLSKMKMDYRAILERLSSDAPASQPWGAVKLIDFAHAFFDDEETTVDDNFREGIDNFVDILEKFLRETDDYVGL